MPVSWEFRGELLVVTEAGVTSNDEIDRAFVREALADSRARPGLAVLWDARRSLTPLSAEDVAWRTRVLWRLAERGLLSRLALLLGPEQSLTAAIANERPALRGLAFGVFTDEPEAAAWLASA